MYTMTCNMHYICTYIWGVETKKLITLNHRHNNIMTYYYMWVGKALICNMGRSAQMHKNCIVHQTTSWSY